MRVDVSLQFYNTREQREVQALLSFCKRFTAWRLLVAVMFVLAAVLATVPRATVVDVLSAAGL